MNFHGHPLDAKSFGNFANQLCRFERRLVKVYNRFATCTDEVVMRMELGIYAQRAVMQAQLANETALNERMERFVHRRKGDTGNLFANTIENFFRAGMARERHQRLINDGTLMRDSQPMTATELPELDLLACAHTLWMKVVWEGFFFDNNY